MIESDDTQPPAPHHNRVLDAFKREERKVFTRPAPKSAKAQMEFLYTRAKQSTKALAEQLGVSTRTVQRYRAGQQTKHAGHLTPQFAAALDVESLVDGLVNHVHLRPVGELCTQSVADLFRAPPKGQTLL